MKIVQIGANRGNDELTRIIREKVNTPNFLLLVEPLEKFNKNLQECYRDVTNLNIENIAIVDDNTLETTTMFLHKSMDENMEQASLKKSHIDMVFDRPEYISSGLSHKEQIIELKVKCSTFNSLMEKYGVNEIDILFIDAEGLDDIIIKSIDFKSITIREIYYENMHINNESLENFLLDRGYQIQHGTSESMNNNIARLTI